MLCGLMPRDGSDADELHRRLLVGRYSEIRMLYFVGKDVFRWIDQCMEWSQGIPELEEAQLVRPKLRAPADGDAALRRAREVAAMGSGGS